MAELGPRLKMWFYVVMKMDDEPGERRRMWEGSFAHFTDQKHRWSGWNDEPAKALLKQFLDASVALVNKCQSKFATQLCECLNSMKAKMASKGISWKTSWKARVCVAILNFNTGHKWKIDAYDLLAAEFGWPALPPRCRARLVSDAEKAAVRARVRADRAKMD
jgi:hypothetical protein